MGMGRSGNGDVEVGVVGIEPRSIDPHHVVRLFGFHTQKRRPYRIQHPHHSVASIGLWGGEVGGGKEERGWEVGWGVGGGDRGGEEGGGGESKAGGREGGEGSGGREDEEAGVGVIFPGRAREFVEAEGGSQHLSVFGSLLGVDP